VTVTFAVTVTPDQDDRDMSGDLAGPFRERVVYVTVLDDGTADLAAHAIVAATYPDGMVLGLAPVAI